MMAGEGGESVSVVRGPAGMEEGAPRPGASQRRDEAEDVRRGFRVGAIWIYRTLSGRDIPHVVVGLDVEPHYRHGDDGRFVRFRRQEDGHQFDIAETTLLGLDWLYPEAAKP